MAIDFPEAIPLKELQVTHDEYSPAKMQVHDDLYEGGEGFKRRIEHYLDRRPLEKGNRQQGLSLDKEDPQQHAGAAAQFSGQMASLRWEERKVVSRYTPYVSGLIDYFVAALFVAEPFVQGEGDYWKRFNQTLSQTLRRLALDSLKHRRTFLALQVPEVPVSNLRDQRARGGLDPVLSCLLARDVDLWEEVAGRLSWLRTYREDELRSQPFGKPDLCRKLWTYVTDEEFIEYELLHTCGEEPKPSDPVTLKSRKTHGFDRLPVSRVDMGNGLHAMARLEAPALKLYNRESAITWRVNSDAFQLLAIVTPDHIDSVVDVGLGGFKMTQGSVSFVGPSSGSFDAHFRDRDDLKRNLYEVFQSMGLNALATQSQNARQAAAAKEIDREPLSALLRAFALALRAALAGTVETIAAYRGEDAPQISGLDRFDTQTMREKFETLLLSVKVPGYPETALREQIKETALAAAPNATHERREQIIREAQNAEIQAPEPAAEPDRGEAPQEKE